MKFDKRGLISVSDGEIQTNLEVLIDADRQDSIKLAGVADSKQTIILPVNCYVFEIGGKLALSDTGAGTFMGPGLGHLCDNMRAAGIDPAQIGYIFLTHIHPDHANGLTDDAGVPRFPNATLVLHEVEAAFWLDTKFGPETSERTRNGAARAKLMTAPYRNRMRRVSDGEVMPGISAVHQPGHTPGHTGWLLTSGAEKVFIWGDAVHLSSVQIPRPATGLMFDIDAAMASQTRQKIFSWLADESIVVAGAHLDTPGYIRRDKDSFKFEPAN